MAVLAAGMLPSVTSGRPKPMTPPSASGVASTTTLPEPSVAFTAPWMCATRPLRLPGLAEATFTVRLTPSYTSSKLTAPIWLPLRAVAIAFSATPSVAT